MTRTNARYLERYAEAEHRLADELSEYLNVLVVPCFDEGDRIAPLLDSIPQEEGTLLIVVINATASASDEARAANEVTEATLRDRGSVLSLSTAELVHANFDTLVIRRTFDESQGVGLARKTGMDVALALRAQGKLTSRWIFGTDADAEVPPDFFSAANGFHAGDAAAFLHAFEHLVVPGYEDAIAAYESHLHLYVAGLAHAGSPYAFHSIGSTIAVDADAYAAVRGVPKRRAAEDFYLLDKLAKVGPIVQSTGAPILLSGRPSHRVPFGTGASVTKPLVELNKTYDPRSYDVLRAWLGVLDSQPDDARTAFRDGVADAERLEPLFDELGLIEAADRARSQTKTRPAYLRNANTYLDGFRTMKLIRGLRGRGYNPVGITRSLADLRAADLARRQAIAIGTRSAQ